MKQSKSTFHFFMKPFLIAFTLLLIFAACSDDSTTNVVDEPETLDPGEQYSFDGPAFDIAATEDGPILIADFGVIKEISVDGVNEIAEMPLIEGAGAFGEPDITFINGLEPTKNGNFYATRSALDLAVGGALFSYNGNSPGIVADIETFTLGDWPDGDAGQIPAWKHVGCEEPVGFTAGPQTNPYHLTSLSDNEFLIADAAGNSLLTYNTNGQIEVVATFGPVISPETGAPKVVFPLDDETNCYVEPVPTAVEIGSDGAYYVSELVGTAPENFGGEPTPEGLASIWRVEAGAGNVECPSDSCTKVVTGLDSVIDIEFGPDGQLYVVEFERSGFLAAVAPDLEIPLAGGTVKKCDVLSGSCEIIEGAGGELLLPGAITFDAADNLWLLDNVFAPTVRSIDWQ